MNQLTLSFFLFLFAFNPLKAQIKLTSSIELQELETLLQQRDSLIFERAFNNCDLTSLQEIISEEFEFYHDQAGITTGKTNFINSIQQGVCGLSYRPRRELVNHSLQVFPLYQGGVLYGAIQTGKHRFYANEKDREEYFTSIADFSHVWQLEEEVWRLKKVLSYNHQGTDVSDIPVLFSDETKVEEWLQSNQVPCVGIGVIEGGKLEQIRVFGYLKDQEKAPYNTLFNVASLTKPIVSMLTLKLVDLGKWDLDESLASYWIDPDVAKDPLHKKLTTRHVLSHQTGFVNWRSWHDTKKLTFDFEPGTSFNYSGEGFEYLRKALEKKFKKPLEVLAKQYLFEPLKMTDTQFYWDEETDADRFAYWHDAKGENTYQDHKIETANAADNLLTTIADYGRFGVYVLNGAGLSENLFEEMISPQANMKENAYMSLGWEVHSNFSNGEYALIHSGSDRGVHALLVLFPQSKEGVVVITNGDNGYRSYERIVLEYLDLGSELWKRK